MRFLEAYFTSLLRSVLSNSRCIRRLLCVTLVFLRPACFVCQEDPSLIPSAVDLFSSDIMDNEFLVVSEPDIFTVILDKISVQCAYTVGKLLALLPR